MEFVKKEPIKKGWSCDNKFCVTTVDGEKYLLRITPKEKSGNRVDMIRMQQAVAALGVPMCKPIEFGNCTEGVYSIQSWIDGEDAEKIIPELSDSEQYAFGLEAGKILKKIHSIPAPETQPDWESRFNEKINLKIKMYQDCLIQFDGAEDIISYIEANRQLLKNRPQSFQHGDYHIGNMMIEKGKLVIIDFDRYDFGDPWEEFNRIVWCAQAAPIFASGMINGYFDNEVPLKFWKLLALYISSNMLSSIPWAIPFGDEEVQTMLSQAKDVLKWYDYMKNPIPIWYFNGYYLQHINGIPYKMKSFYDFGFMNRYGTVFKVFDDQDSGNICFGTEKEGQKFFIKYAGSPTESYEGTTEDAVKRLQATLPIYRELKHKNLIGFLEAEKIAGGYAMIFKWANGDCMGRMYPKSHRRFFELPVEARLKVFHDLCCFVDYVNSQGYVALDFYDGSVLYDFENEITTICDIDLFRKKPCINDMGRMWGSSIFMSPEEFQLKAEIDEITNVYTMGAFAFALFGNYDRSYDKWSLNKNLYSVATKATSSDRDKRQQSIKQLIEEWNDSI